jgi:Flp pilus assembly protein TadG
MKVGIAGLGRLRRHEGGMAAVEFGLIAPLMLLMFIGTVEISQAVGLDRRVALAAASTADLIARDKTIADSSAMAEKMKLVKHLMQPYDDSRIKLSIYQVTADPSNATDLKVSWSYGFQGGAAPAKCAPPPEALPAGLLGQGASVVVVKAEYDYEPLIFSHYLSSGLTLTDKATMSPRNSCVVYGSNNPNCMLSCS